MKILRLRLLNLNSLRGETVIDFTQAPLSSSGLFAITGPTGAGKTTLLDGITLALYGRAARYGNTANPENIMSRHTGEALAEVEFACAKGSFRSLWQRQRARKKPEGNLQPPKRQLMSLPGGEILTEKISEADAKIAELTGLDYDRFLRSVLLAQGEFAAFLKADAKDRTELLQEVTGTAIYQEISEAAFRRAAEADKACEALRKEHQAVQVLDEASRAAKKAEQEALEAKLGSLFPQVKEQTERLGFARRLLELQQERERLDKARTAHEAASLQAAPVLERLASHEKALPHKAELDAGERLRIEQANDSKALELVETKIPGLQQQVREAETDRTEALRVLGEEQTRQEQAQALWAEIEALDQQLAAVTEAGQQLRTQTDKARELVKASEEALAKEQAGLAATRAKAEVEGAWLAQNAADAGLAARLVDLQTGHTRWSALERNLQELKADVQRALKEQERLAQALDVARAKIPSVQAELIRHEDALQAATRELETQAKGETAEGIEALAENARERHGRLLALQAGALALGRQAEALKLKEAESLRLEASLNESTKACEARRRECDITAQLVGAQRKKLELAQTLQSLEHHRGKLTDGNPCPLCGAIHHPYASPETLPSAEVKQAQRELKVSETAQYAAADALSAAEKQEAGLQADALRVGQELPGLRSAQAEALLAWNQAAGSAGLVLDPSDTQGIASQLGATLAEQQGLTARLTALRDLDKQCQRLRAQSQLARETLAKAEADLKTCLELADQAAKPLPILEEKRASLLKSLDDETRAFADGLPLGVSQPTEAAEALNTLQVLRKRAEAFAQHQAAQQVFTAEIQVHLGKWETLTAQTHAAAASLARLEEDLAKAKADYKRQKETRQGKFGDQVLAEVRRGAAEALSRLNEKASQTAERLAHRRLDYEKTAQEQERLKRALQDRKATLERVEANLREASRLLGLADEAALRAALLPGTEASGAAKVRKQLEDEGTRIKVLSNTLQTQLEALPGTATQDLACLDALQAELGKLEAERDETNRRLGQLSQLLANDDAQRERQSAFIGQIDAAQKEAARWNKLNALIGSADGTAFAKFAQGLTLDRLCVLANKHLSQLNPRYSMRRASDKAGDELELEIVDAYQAGAFRPMNSLSGGESFLASLALALALSALAGGKTSIESLFIDEGFGSLDADTLETAMSALENLQSTGKTIGIISHVPSMRERIPTQIQVMKTAAGCSEVRILTA